ncbi:CBS domain-containing protein [Solemya velum gill symbiont]|uniref:CBS domain-containing protein n=1 Tax=Solemya velum gill symbiont TaxID=2340 RepID=UPI000996B44C|nr:CBS domain-containing protein [Solemya velum gill symbiont]OOY59923.1 CBS domain-containing protein [Solemya velum gill symbiont]OOY82525.1 CBS domain-containing protein [Solemya velum gill symbiont]OOY84894.1 CBS domain-containing protein [Solemya velum gill symbiont]OOY92681.1 CBS domain-containing protein [Solemya velum gill symbiont]
MAKEVLRALTVKQYMARDIVTFKPDTGVMDAIHTLITRRVSGAPVVDDHGNVVSILSEKDCMQVMLNACYHEELGGKVSEYMKTDVQAIEAETSIVEAAEMFNSSPVRRFPVVDDNSLVGQISRRDVLRALEKIW